MEKIAIITARGGSKRIPNKNINLFMGKPMISYAIEVAKQSGVFDVVMVSTDSIEIATIAKKYGAEVPFLRSERTSNDTATTYDVLQEVLEEYKKLGKHFDVVGCIYPCVPLLKSETIKKAFTDMCNLNANGAQPVCAFPAPIEWAMRMEEGYLIPDNTSALTIRSQDLKKKYYDAGMFYLCRTEALLCEMTLVPSKTIGIVVDESECQDIDTIEDWHAAEIKYKVLEESANEKVY